VDTLVNTITSIGDRDRASVVSLVVPGLNYNSMLEKNLDNLRYQCVRLTLKVSQESRYQSLMVDKNSDFVSQ